MAYYAEIYDKRGRMYLFINMCWAVDKDGCLAPQGYFVADVQRIHSSNTYVYETLENEDAREHAELDPSYFQIEFLKSRYGGR